jgi:diguanylate cyclase (GGDEF)-like protein
MSGNRSTGPNGGAPMVDLAPCDLEPIHTPGAIQPHGAVVVALARGLRVTHASANLQAILGYPAETALGRPLQDVIGTAACEELQHLAAHDAIADGQVLSLPSLERSKLELSEPELSNLKLGNLEGGNPERGNLDLRAYRSGRFICVDIEPIHREPSQKPPIILAQSVLETLKHATTRVVLCELAVVGLRAITGFDRVMAYRFHREGYGEVIAEARSARLEPYLGLRYPASDIPPQARRLYLRQHVGTIADSSYQPVPLLADPSLKDDTQVDLTHSTLRSASPIHREYMRNMKTAASLTIGLVHSSPSSEPTLWGMLVCHHARPMVAGPELRAVADMVGQVVSLLLGSLSDAEVYAQRFERQTILNTLVNRLAGPLPLAQALTGTTTGAGEELLQLVDATGAMVRIDGVWYSLGQTPPLPAVESALAVLQPLAGDAVLAVDDLGRRHPELATCTADGSGAMLLALGQSSNDVILWFRPELSRTVAWGGNPTEHVTSNAATGRLTPRASFVAWKEIVRGRSEPWAEVDLALARELRTALAVAVAQRTGAELANLRHYDDLTGLPNRSLFQQRLTEAEGDVGTSIALLFLDLDKFKAVNDTMGHATGDALLIEVARRLLGTAGPDHVTARLGGDEFVVLCRGLNNNAVGDLAERIRTAIEAPYEVAGRSCSISASIGIAIADQLGGLDIVRAADTAMYAAKQRGGNSGVVFSAQLYDRATRQAELESELREALVAGDQFTLLYQPMFRIVAATRRLVGFEALLRWRHPRHGWMSPDQFMEPAEKSGLILPLGEWVLATALRQGRVLQQIRPDEEFRMAVNISARQFPQTGFCSGLVGALESEAFPPAALVLEVTDNILTNVAATLVLGDIRKLGVRVAIDDFGIGHSTLPYLRQLQVDEVKLDRRFLKDVEGDARGTALVGAVIALAHAAGIPVVFESIETKAEADIALGAGADIVQGFFFAPPMSASAAEDFVAHYLKSDVARLWMSKSAEWTAHLNARRETDTGPS